MISRETHRQTLEFLQLLLNCPLVIAKGQTVGRYVDDSLRTTSNRRFTYLADAGPPLGVSWFDASPIKTSSTTSMSISLYSAQMDYTSPPIAGRDHILNGKGTETAVDGDGLALLVSTLTNTRDLELPTFLAS